ncbi:hypothetical protein [Stenotrophomonas phage SOVA965]
MACKQCIDRQRRITAVAFRNNPDGWLYKFLKRRLDQMEAGITKKVSK